MPNLLKARGLITYKNNNTVPDGSMDVADNVIIDEDDVIEVRRGQGQFGDSLPEETDRVKKILEYKDLIIRHYGDTIQFDDKNGTFTNFTGTYQELEDGLRIKHLEANGNLYFTDITGIKKISASNDSQVTADSVFDAGVPRAVSLDATLNITVGGFLPPLSKTAYRVLWGKKDNNGNLLLGYPSERYVLTNNSSSVEINESFQIQVLNVPTNDDILTFSSTSDDYFIWFDTTGSEEAPQTNETLGKTAVKITLLTSSSPTTITAASKIANAIAGLSGFSVAVATNVVTVEVTEAENVEDPVAYIAGAESSLNILPTVLQQGSVTEGTYSTANVTFSVPSEVDSTYFYQIYRAASVSVPEGLTLDDIDPGDEMNLVYEGNPLDASGNLLSEVTVEDITTEDFRASATLLYTNPISGQGILQANARPPIAKDITLFSGSSFYANTKTTHKFSFNLVSVLSMASDLSDFVIANELGDSRYVAVGETQVQDVEVNGTSLNEKAFLVNSVEDKRKYTVWFDLEGTGTAPTDSEFDNTTYVRVRYESTDTTDDISVKLATALAAVGDFTLSVLGSVVTITWDRNGNVIEDARDSVNAVTGFVFSSPSVVGRGEDLSNNEFLLSSSTSVAVSIDESARSLVKVINADSNSPVNAYYLSGPDDVPGIILLENKSLEDVPFYVTTSDVNILDSFDSSLTLEKTITSTTQGASTNIESPSHGLFTGQEVFIKNVNTTPSIDGFFQVTYIDNDNFSINFETTSDSLNEGEFFLASNKSDNEVKPNRVYYSKVFQPEAVPLANYIDIGPKDKSILRILPLRDNLFALKEDGVYIISGTTAPDFSVRLLDSSVSLVAPDTAVVLNNSIYCLSDDGVVRISDTGVEVMSRSIENLIKEVVNSRFNYETIAFGVEYSSDRCYMLWLPESVNDTYATQCYRYNTFTQTWTRFTVPATCGLVMTRDDKLYLGDGESNGLTQERKLGNRTDYADKSFELSVLFEGVNSNIVSVSSTSEVKIGDVIYQEQYITISTINRLLRKLDIDKGISSLDYHSTLEMNYGDNVALKLNSIVDKLILDGIAVTDRTFSNDIEIQRDEYDILIGELNNVNSGTSSKNYKEALDLTSFEMVIENIDTLNNTLDLKKEIPLVEGDVLIYKGIDAKIQYAPEDFGDPSSLKQVRQGTIIFDQNSFYGGTIAYASDQSADFIETSFSGYGIGDWGVGDWGEGTWGGLGNDIPYRTLVPLEKQRCRYITVQIQHINAREIIRINGISLMVRLISNRAYR